MSPCPGGHHSSFLSERVIGVRSDWLSRGTLFCKKEVVISWVKSDFFNSSNESASVL